VVFAGQALRSTPGLRRLSILFQIEFILGGIMFEGIFQPMHLMVIAGIALLIFGPKKLPEFGKGLGEGIRGFKAAMQGKDEATTSSPSEPGVNSHDRS
jgi:sec-independent protein translocase protein TatA